MSTHDRIIVHKDTSAVDGRVVWDPIKSLWFMTMMVGGLIGVVYFFTWIGCAIFLISTAITICFGHSIGMHRLLIHRSFKCSKWLEYILVYLGTLVSMAGPLKMFKIHDIRDWQQCQSDCHSYAKHDVGFLTDAWWQMNCQLKLDRPPELKIEDDIKNDRFYIFLDQTLYAQQIPWAIVFYLMAGWSGIFLGIFLRCAISLAGHWSIVYVAHTRGQRPFVNDEIAVDGRNNSQLAIITFGEAWHNNHHAFPSSARLGHKREQIDIGWWFIKAFGKLGWAWDIQIPAKEWFGGQPAYEIFR